MNWVIGTFAVFVTFIAICTWIVIHMKGSNWLRALAVVSFLSSIPAVALALYLSLGIAFPVGYKYLPTPTEDLTLVAFKPVPGVGIFLLVDAGDYTAPKFYRIPWNKNTAEEMQAQLDANGVQPKINLAPSGKGRKLGNWEFSFGDETPRITSEDPPEIQFELKNNPRNGPVVKVLPPATEN